MTLNNRQVNAIFERANNFMRMGNLDSAIADYDLVIEHQPDFAPAYFNRAFARQHGRGDLDGAIQDYDRALELKPGFAEAYVNRAIAHHHRGDFSAALDDYASALDCQPQMSQAYVNRGELHFLRGDFAAAVADFERAQALKPGYRYAIAGLAVSLHAQDESEESYRLWQSLMARNEGFRNADWVRDELGWHETLVAEAQRLIAEIT